MEHKIREFLEYIENKHENGRYVVGIDGLSRSGKTTFVGKLTSLLMEKEIHHSIIHIDDHIVERNKRYGTREEEWIEYYTLQWDIDWLKRNLFQKIKSDNELILPFYDSPTDRHQSKSIQLPEKCLIIIEGVFLQRQEWKTYYDFVVYLNCPRDERFQRENESTQRNIEKFRTRYWKAEEHYVRTESPLEKADLIIHS